MSSALSARFALRAATADAHERVDRAFSRFELREPDGYAGFLQAQAKAFLPLEAAVEAARPERFLADWPSRRRAHLLCNDLAVLGVTVDPGASPVIVSTAPNVLGVVYVLEGSRLGGAMLKRQVPESLPRRFLDAGDAALWRSLVQLMDAQLRTDDDRAEATRAAKAAFDLFEHCARSHPRAPDLV